MPIGCGASIDLGVHVERWDGYPVNMVFDMGQTMYDMTRKEIFRYTWNCRHSILTLKSPTREEEEDKAVTFRDQQIMIVARAIAVIGNHMDTRTMPPEWEGIVFKSKLANFGADTV